MTIFCYRMEWNRRQIMAWSVSKAMAIPVRSQGRLPMPGSKETEYLYSCTARKEQEALTIVLSLEAHRVSPMHRLKGTHLILLSRVTCGCCILAQGRPSLLSRTGMRGS